MLDRQGRQLVVYKDEIEAGLESELLDSSKSVITIAALVEPIPTEELASFKLEVGDAALAVASAKKDGLYPLKTLLVSTGWNNNDDVFDPAEVWAARHTPEDKPFNLEHNEADIIGHITDNIVVNDKLRTIADNTKFEDLPNKFHIVTGAVLYTTWASKDRQDRLNEIIQEIAKGQWYVSMECWFSGFDYSLRNEKETKVVARDKSTAYLTKHLLRYGGRGEYEGYKVGRLMRNIVFSGKGLVRKPANPQSVIFTESIKSLGTITINQNNSNSTDVVIDIVDNSELKQMPTDSNENLARELAEVKQSLATSEVKQNLMATELKQKTEKLADVEKTLAEVTTKTAKAELDRDQAVADLNKVKAELAKVQKEAVKASRVNELIKAGLDEGDAKVKAEAFVDVNDTVFAAFVETLASLKRPDMEDYEEAPPPMGNNTPKGEAKPKLKVQKQPGLKQAGVKSPYQDETAEAADADDESDDDEKKDMDKAKKGKAAKSAKVKQKKNADDQDNDDDDNSDDDYDSEADASELETEDEESEKISLAADLEDETSDMHAFASFIGKEIWGLDKLDG